ncbi:aldehyde dehydrogenase family 3 member F1-like isoform X1 [Musa acuminata AAA Group]|uniref:aldehyde dehydrogenase family 3 member F1-like isoform X1 n=1 Tax=Musa acuminata AAA Group TaxID=214697 RepID=UPI0031D49B28
MESVGVEGVANEVRTDYESGKTRSLAWRRSQLKALQRLLYEEEEGMFTALKQDLGKHQAEAYRDEVGILIKSVNYALENLKKWMTPCRVPVPLLAFPTRGELVPEPLGVVLIFSSWNFPIGLSLEPLIGAIAAGNAIVLKPSELAPASSNFLAKSVPKYLDSMSVKVVRGGPDVGQKLLEQKWDKIFFTGSSRVARIVMAAAAKHLTPVAVELGGKSPAIFDSLSSARDRKVAVERIVGAKWVPCSGQVCIGVDYVLVEEQFAPILIDQLKATLEKFYPRFDCLSRIINEQHFQRLSNLIKDPSVAATIIHGGSLDSETLFIEPTILLDPPLDAEIMNEEIFGPLLPIITLKKIEDSIEFIRARPKPLVIYAFTKDEKLRSRITAETSSGSLTFNDTMIQVLSLCNLIFITPWHRSRSFHCLLVVRLRRIAIWRSGWEWVRTVPRQVLLRHVQSHESRAEEELPGGVHVPVPAMGCMEAALHAIRLPLRLRHSAPSPAGLETRLISTRSPLLLAAMITAAIICRNNRLYLPFDIINR